MTYYIELKRLPIQLSASLMLIRDILDLGLAALRERMQGQYGDRGGGKEFEKGQVWFVVGIR